MTLGNRLIEKQRPTKRPQVRPQRADFRSNEYNGTAWGQAEWPYVAPEDADQSVPGDFDPVESTPPTLEHLLYTGLIPSIIEAWDGWVELGDGTAVYWDGDEWTRPVITAGTPATYLPGDLVVPNVAALTTMAITASPTTAWTTGQNYVCGNAATAHWNGTAWVAGVA